MHRASAEPIQNYSYRDEPFENYAQSQSISPC